MLKYVSSNICFVVFNNLLIFYLIRIRFYYLYLDKTSRQIMALVKKILTFTVLFRLQQCIMDPIQQL